MIFCYIENPRIGVFMRTRNWRVQWVDDMPEAIEPGYLYISTKHRLMEHKCACGCGTEVSLPLSRSDWRIKYDGDTISICPSIGNWRLPCGSHYVIKENRTIWCPAWTDDQIAKGRRRDRAMKRGDIRRKNLGTTWLGRFLTQLGFRI